MKTITCVILFKILLLISGYAQNNAIVKLVTPVKNGITLFKKSGPEHNWYSFSTFSVTDEPGKNFLPFLNSQPVLKIQTASRRHLLIFTEFSFADLMENTINSVDDSLLKKYDDNISELFRDAPSLFKLKCSIGL